MFRSPLARTLLVSLAVAALATAPLAAQAATVVDDGSSGRALSAELLGANEAGPAGGDPDATGTAVVTVNAGQGELCYSVEFSGVAPVAGHIHDGEAGVNGPVVIPLAVAGATSTASGCADVSRELLRDILIDPSGYYVNLHSAEFPAGAIRGQLGR